GLALGANPLALSKKRDIGHFPITVVTKQTGGTDGALEMKWDNEHAAARARGARVTSSQLAAQLGGPGSTRSSSRLAVVAARAARPGLGHALISSSSSSRSRRRPRAAHRLGLLVADSVVSSRGRCVRHAAGAELRRVLINRPDHVRVRANRTSRLTSRMTESDPQPSYGRRIFALQN